MQFPSPTALFLSIVSKLNPVTVKQFVADMYATLLITWKRLLVVFIVMSVLCSVIGVFIPFVSVRSFGLGGGVVCTLLVWYLAYIAVKNEGN